MKRFLIVTYTKALAEEYITGKALRREGAVSYVTGLDGFKRSHPNTFDEVRLVRPLDFNWYTGQDRSIHKHMRQMRLEILKQRVTVIEDYV